MATCRAPWNAAAQSKDALQGSISIQPQATDLFQQQGFQSRVDGFAYILNQHRLPKAHSPLNETQESGLAELDQLEASPGLHVAQPSIGLPLGVDHQRPPLALAHQNAVIHRHIVCRQTPQPPVSHLPPTAAACQVSRKVLRQGGALLQAGAVSGRLCPVSCACAPGRPTHVIYCTVVCSNMCCR